MQIVSIGDILLEMSNPVSRQNKKNITNLLSAELAQRLVKVKCHIDDVDSDETAQACLNI